MALVDEGALEAVGEAQVFFVVVGQCVLSGDGDEAAQVHASGVTGEELIGDFFVVGAGFAFADAVVHQAREARLNVDRWVQSGAGEVAGHEDLAFGDVTGQVGDRVGDVIAWHRKNRNLRDRAFFAFDHSGAFVEGCKVGVHVAWVSASAWDFFSSATDFAQRLAVVGQVGQDHENVVALFERQVFGCGQRHAWGQQAFDGRIVGFVQEQD